MFGFLNIDKPPAVTSRDVVNRVEKLVRPVKVGHAGTLDPLATGVLVLAMGQATRLVQYVQRLPKTYRGTFLLGRRSDTEDVDGQVVELIDAPTPSLPALESAAQQFIGTIQQRPPAYSALKIAGQRAYELARRGQDVDLAPRPVEIYSIEIVRYDYPELELLVRCGSGTYIRTLGRDLAELLGTSAVMSQLRRLAIGPFRVDHAICVTDLGREQIDSRLLSPRLSLEGLPSIEVSEMDVQKLLNGLPIANVGQLRAVEIAAVNTDGRLVAIVKSNNSHFVPVKCFAGK
jgi:tRNA pseudouridine55 synthase